MRPKTLLACAASVLAASATFGVGATAPAAGQATAPAADRANVSDFLAGQLSGLTGRTTVMVHGTSIAAARQAVAATGMREDRRVHPDRRRHRRRHPQPGRRGPQPGRSDVRRGRGAADRLLQPGPRRDLQHRDPRRGGGRRPSPVPTARRSTGKGVSVAVIDSGVDPTHPYFKEADGSQRRGRQPQGAVRAARPRPARCSACPPSSTPTPSPSAATAPTSTASSPVARPR